MNSRNHDHSRTGAGGRGRDGREERTPVPPHRFHSFNRRMRGKLMFLFLCLLALFAMLVGNIIRINRDNGDEYKRQVLMQQSYDSTTLPFRRGTITDAKGTTLATSTLVYNVILDAKQMLEKKEYLEPSLKAIQSTLDIDSAKVRELVKDNPSSQYYILKKNIDLATYNAYMDAKNADSNVQGIYFEQAYIRSYPNDSLASDVIGFANANNEGSYGLEEYYNDILNGTPGREYGYISGGSDVEKTTIPATDGDNLQLTLDANIQAICEKYLQKFNDEHKDEARSGNGARNVGVIVMDPNTGGVLSMASYPGFNLNKPYDTAPLVGMTKLDFDHNDQPMENEYLTQEDVDALTDEEKTKYLNALWKNYCISDYYEPGSTAKPFTTAAGLESGSFSPTQTYLCEGSLTVAEGTAPIKCHNTNGDGILSVGEAIERSCNVALMQEALAIGKETFCKFQNIFGFGLKTNIDLANEARTDGMIYTADKMGITDLATNSFGQNFDVTMIQMAAGFCSLINGGDYYQPHVVSKITSASGATIRTIEPHVIKKTVSEETSAWIRSYCEQVVAGANGTGHTARPAGYMIGGKTGTAETIPRNMGQYVVSFMGFAPVDDPKVLIYVVVDRPNSDYQADAKFATGIVRDCLTEILPYMNIPMTEELSDEEKQELQELQSSGTLAMSASEMAALGSSDTASGQDGTDSQGDDGQAQTADGQNTENGSSAASGEEISGTGTAQTDWRNFPKDEVTGYYINPTTGHYVDAQTGQELDTGPEGFTGTGTGTSTGTNGDASAEDSAGTASVTQNNDSQVNVTDDSGIGVGTLNLTGADTTDQTSQNGGTAGGAAEDNNAGTAGGDAN